MDFRKLVKDKIEELGVRSASKFFGVSLGTVSNWHTGKTSPSLEAVELALGDHDWETFNPKPIATEEVKEVKWEGKNVIILQPVYRTLNADTHFTLFANYAKYGADKIGLIQEKRTVIHEARNILSHKFLQTTAEYAIMVDDDMILPCGSSGIFNGRYGAGVSEESASFNAITRIMSHSSDKEIVGALYFGRHRAGKAQCSRGFTSESENKALRKFGYSGLIQDEWVGTGFMRIHRSVFDKFKQAIDGGKWPECHPPADDSWYGFFNPIRVRMGEDVSFCRRAKELGIQTYIDTSLICLHNGECNWGPSNIE
jgi:hypothetical protein